VPGQKAGADLTYKYKSFALSISPEHAEKEGKRTTYSHYRRTPSGEIDRVFHTRIPDDAGSIAAVPEKIAPHPSC